MSGFENLILRIIREKGSACAADIAKILYPMEENLRPKISQVSVMLRRLERKGAIIEVGKEGKKVYFSILEDSFNSGWPKVEFLDVEEI